MIATIVSLLLTAFGAYFFFLSGMNYLGGYVTGAMIPYRNSALLAGVVGIVALGAAHLLYYFFPR